MKSNFDEQEGASIRNPQSAIRNGEAFKLRQYQLEDIARAALHDGAILGWDPGLGKTAAAFLWPMLKGARTVLIVAPGGLHDQIIKEGKEKFRIKVRPLMSQADFLADPILKTIRCPNQNAPALESTLNPQPSTLNFPQYWLTTYQALGYNGADEFGERLNESGEVIRNRQRERNRYSHPGFHDALRANVKEITETITTETGATPDVLEKINKLSRLAKDPAAYAGEIENALDFIKELRAKYSVTRHTSHVTCHLPATDPRTWFNNIGHTRVYPASDNPQSAIRNPQFSITCVYTPTLARLCSTTQPSTLNPQPCIFDAVEIDEGVRLKATESYISQGVRALRPKFRLVLTGTPIKNILIDLFWLAHWICNGGPLNGTGSDMPTARWPYENQDDARERFANEHMLQERNVTREEDTKALTGKRVRYVKRTAQICNIHRLWKLLGPVIIRRRKDDCGEDLVPKTVIPIRVRPGTIQQKVYSRYLKYRPIMAKGSAQSAIRNPQSAIPEGLHPGAAIGMQLQLLRQAALCPDSLNLSEAILKPEADEYPRRSNTDLNPKSAAILSLIADLLVKGEQVCVISPFQHFNQTLTRRLKSAGVSVVLADGTINPMKRGKLAADFKAGVYSVLVGSTESMSEGHSFECCAHLILPSLTWALDKNAQAIERVHRLNSTRPVKIYVMVTENTIDARLESLFSEKRDSSNLALDGRLFAEKTQEINLAQLLNEAMANFNPAAPTLDEEEMKKEWDLRLRDKLRHAEATFRDPTTPPFKSYGAALLPPVIPMPEEAEGPHNTPTITLLPDIKPPAPSLESDQSAFRNPHSAIREVPTFHIPQMAEDLFEPSAQLALL